MSSCPNPSRFSCVVLAVALSASSLWSAPPSNDAFENAEVLSDSRGSIEGTLADSAREDTYSYYGGDSSRGTVWYRWTGDQAGMLYLADASETGWRRLTALTGGSTTDLVQLADGDGAVAVAVVPNRVLFFEVGYATNLSDPAEEDFTLNWEFVPAPVLESFEVEGTPAEGADISLVATATGDAPLTYYWYHDDVLISGQDTARMSQPAMSAEDAGRYRVVVQNRGGVVHSAELTVSGAGLGPHIQKQPSGGVFTAGDDVVLKVEATGEGTIAYQWRRHGIPLEGATDTSLTLEAISMGDADTYDVVISDSVGFVASRSIRLTVGPTHDFEALAFRADWNLLVEKPEATVEAIASAAGGGYWVAGTFTRFDKTSVGRVVRMTASGKRVDSFAAARNLVGDLNGLMDDGEGGVWLWGNVGELMGSVRAGGLRRYDAQGRQLLALDGPNIDSAAREILGAGRDGEGRVYLLFSGANAGDPVLRRVSGAGIVDPSYLPDLTGLADMTGIAVTADGTVFAWTSEDVRRLRPDGSLDTSFSFERGDWARILGMEVGPDDVVVAFGSADPSRYYVNQPLQWRRWGADGAVLVGRSGEADLRGTNSWVRGVGSFEVGLNGELYVSAFTISSNGFLEGKLWRLVGDGEVAPEQVLRLGRTGERLSGEYEPRWYESVFTRGEDGCFLIGGGFNYLDDQTTVSLALWSSDTPLQPAAEEFWSRGQVNALVEERDGSLVLGGEFGLLNGEAVVNLARLQADGALDTGFAVTENFVQPVVSVMRDGAGRWLIVGESKPGQPSDGIALGRLTSEGSWDDGFATSSGDFSGNPTLGVTGGGYLSAGSTPRSWIGFHWYGEDGSIASMGEYDGMSLVFDLSERLDGRVVVTGGPPYSFASGTPPATPFHGGGGIGLLSEPSHFDPVYGYGYRSRDYVLKGVQLAEDGLLVFTPGAVLRRDAQGRVDDGFRVPNLLSAPYAKVVELSNGDVLFAGGVNMRASSDSIDSYVLDPWARVRVDGSIDSSATLNDLQESVTALLQRADGNFYVATEGRVRLTKASSPEAPTIVRQPVSGEVDAGETYWFTVEVSGSPQPTLQWNRDGVAIPGATSQSLAITNAQAADAATYSVTVSNSEGSVTSNGAELRLNLPPAITSQPPAAVVKAVGDTLTFRVAATGAVPLSYQWRKDGVDISGANAATLVLGPLTIQDAGNYAVVVTNRLGTVVSETAVLSVNQTPTVPVITQQPRDMAGRLGDRLTLSVAATGYPQPTYQWRRNGVAIDGADASELALNPLEQADAGAYDVVATNSQGNVSSNLVFVTVSSADVSPVITAQPRDTTVAQSSAVTFKVAATAVPQPTYQWHLNGIEIPGATEAAYTIAAATATDAGVYSVTIANGSGTVVSRDARLTILSKIYAGVYFGSFGEGRGQFALFVDDHNTGNFLGFDEVAGLFVSGEVTVNQDGSFGLIVTSEATSAAASTHGRSVGADARNEIVVIGPPVSGLDEVSFAGSISDAGILVGTVTGVSGLSMTAAKEVGETTAAVAGYYAANSSGGDALALSILSATGKALVLTRSPSGVDAGNGTVDDAGAIAVTTVKHGSFTATVSAERSTIDAQMTDASGSSLTFAGGDAGVIAAQRLVNISSRVFAGNGVNQSIAGFVITGEDSKPVLIRAVGPGLSQFGVAGTLAFPRLALVKDGAVVAENQGWASTDKVEAISAASTVSGAFALAAGSADSVILTTLAPGHYTANVQGSDAAEGVVLVEVYDLSGLSLGQKLFNISTRSWVGTGDKVMVAGFVVQGVGPKRVLLRGCGPALAEFGLPGVLTDPVLKVFRSGAEIARNDDWSENAAAVTEASAVTGAFGLTDGSKDAAMVISLDPGAYTLQLEGKDSATGIGLVEVYEVP